MYRTTAMMWLVTTALLGGAACSKTRTLPAPVPLEPVSAEEARAFGEALVTDLQSCNASALLDKIRYEDAARQALIDSSLKGEALVQFANEFEAGWKGSLAQQLDCGTGDNTLFRIEAVRERDGFPTVVVSELDGSVTIKEYFVGRLPNGDIVTRDYVDWSSGLGFQRDVTLMIDLLVEDHFRLNDSMAALMSLRNGDSEGGMYGYSQLSAHSQKNLKLIISALNALAGTHDEGYWAMRERLAKEHPEFPPPAYLDMSYYTNGDQWDEALAALASWDEQMGGIPGLRLTRARMLLSANKVQEAISIFRELIAETPADMALREELVAFLVEFKDYDAARATAQELFELSGSYWDEEGGLEAGWKEFMATQQWRDYQAWLQPQLVEDEGVEVDDDGADAP